MATTDEDMSNDQSSMPDDGSLRVRLATIADAEAFVRFNRAMAQETENKELPLEIVDPGVRAVFENSAHGFYVVAECAGDIVGALMVTYEWSDWRNGLFWWIQSVYVTPEFRRKGVYRRLYAYVRDRARSQGNVCGFRLYVEKGNRSAQNAYESLGMTESDYLMYEETLKP